MADIYKSKFTGQEIDDILTNASNVTNIEVNPSGEATEELTKITIGETTYSIPEGTVVEGNPSESATEELTKITIGETTYSIPEGTVVEGNPSESATEELTKITIGETTYSIPEGGGGSGGGKGATLNVGYGITVGTLYHSDGSRDDTNYNNVVAFVFVSSAMLGVSFNNAVLCFPPTGTPFFSRSVEEVVSNTVVVPLEDTCELFAHDL